MRLVLTTATKQKSTKYVHSISKYSKQKKGEKKVMQWKENAKTVGVTWMADDGILNICLHTTRHTVKVNEYLPFLVCVLCSFSSFFLFILREFLHLRNFRRILWPFKCCCSFCMLRIRKITTTNKRKKNKRGRHKKINGKSMVPLPRSLRCGFCFHAQFFLVMFDTLNSWLQTVGCENEILVNERIQMVIKSKRNMR